MTNLIRTVSLRNKIKIEEKEKEKEEQLEKGCAAEKKFKKF
jgi:hypothetical protein